MDPATNRIYTSVNFVPGVVWVIDGNANTSVTIITGLADQTYGRTLRYFDAGGAGC